MIKLEVCNGITCEEFYESSCGFKMEREGGLTPNGNKMSNRWVLRDPKGAFIDFDTFRSDLAERNNLELY